MSELPYTNIGERDLIERISFVLQSKLHHKCDMEEIRTLAHILAPMCEGEIPYRVADFKNAIGEIRSIAERELRREGICGKPFLAFNSIQKIAVRQISLLNTSLRD